MSRPVKVWDVPSRLTHWLLALSVLGAYGSAEWGWLDMQWHFYCGYSALTLVLFRVLWGFFGSEHARFSQFLRGPGAVIAYLRGLFSRDSKESVGHSAVGGWAVILLLLGVFAQGFSGLFNSDDIVWFGPLNEKASAEWVDNMASFHESFYNVLLLIIGVHIIAALLYLLAKKQNLITPMLTGIKHSVDAPDAKQKPLWLALILFGISAAMIWALITFWPVSS
jgi:cytochrome b